MRRGFLPLLATLTAFSASLAHAQDTPDSFSRGYGMDYESWSDPINPSTRDDNGNRVVLNGRITDGSSLSGGLMDEGGFGSAFAVGNQLNVVTQGSWNTVIIDSTQVNNGDVSANVDGE